MPPPSALPAFAVERFEFEGAEEGAMLKVTCPRKRCGRSFWASVGWKRPHKVNGRTYETASCPWCFGTARIPGRRVKRRMSK